MRLRRRRHAESTALVDASWGVPGRFNFARDVVEELAADPLLPALTYVDEEGIVDRRTFAELARDASRWAHLLRSRADAGGCVVVVADHVPGWHALLLGALKGGVVISPAVATIDADELARRVQLLRPALVVADRLSEEAVDALEGLRASPPVLYLDEAAGELRRHPGRAPTEDTGALDPALVVFGGGPDALPVVHHHASTWAARLTGRHLLGAGTGDLVWVAAPTDSVELLWSGVLAPWSCGAEVLAHALPFEPEERMALVQRLGVTALGQRADEHARLAAILPELPLLDHQLDRLLSFGEPLEPAVAETLLEELGVRVDESLGLPELPLLVGATGADPPPRGALGSPLPDHELDVVDADGTPAADGVEGELVLLDRPPTLFLEYLSMPEATAAAFTGGCFHTGVRAVRDEQGVLWPPADADRAGAAPGEVDRAALVAAAAERARIAEQAERVRREQDERERRDAAIRAEEERARREQAARELAEHQEREAREAAARAEEEQRRIEQERRAAERRAEEERRRHEEAARELAERQEREARQAAAQAEEEQRRVEQERRDAERRAEEERRALEAQTAAAKVEQERRDADRDAAQAAEAGQWLTAEQVARQRAEHEDAERRAQAEQDAQDLREQQDRAAAEAERREHEEREEQERQERAARELAKRRERETREAARDAERERKRLQQEAREAAKRAEAERKRHEQLERELARQREREAREAAKRAEAERKRQEREERETARRAEEERRRLEREARRVEEGRQRGRRDVQPSIPEPGDDIDDTPIPDVAERLRYYGASSDSRPTEEQRDEPEATERP